MSEGQARPTIRSLGRATLALKEKAIARFFITNRDEIFAAILRRWREAGLASDILPGSLHAAAARKRVVDRENSVVGGADRWLLAVGSYWDGEGRWSADALGPLLARIQREDLRPADHLSGHFATGWISGEAGAVSCDPAASHELFFTESGGSFAVGTALADFLHVPWLTQQPDDFALIKAAFHGQRGLGEESLFPGVRAVRGHQTVVLGKSGEGWCAALKDGPPLAFPPAKASFDEAVSSYKAHTVRLLERMRQAGPAAVTVTGGADSRLVLAAASEAGLADRLLYGRGNSDLTNTKRQDRAAAKALAETLGAPLTVMDWRQDRPWSPAERARLQKRHGFNQPYGGAFGVAASHGGAIDPYPALQLAGYGPAFVNAKPWMWEEEHVPLRTFARRYAAFYLDIFADPDLREAHLDTLEADLRSLTKGFAALEGREMFSLDQCTALWALAKASKEAFNVNAFNEYADFVAPHLTGDLLFEMLAVPGKWRRGDRFQLSLMKAHDPRVLSVPFYSGTRPFTLDRENLSLRPVDYASDVGLLPRAAGRLADEIEKLGDRSRAFRRDAAGALQDLLALDGIDRQRLASADLRALYRLITAREISAGLGRTGS